MKICLQNVCVRFGEHTVLDSVNVCLDKPGIYGLIGISGSGKTTFLRVISQLQKPDTGIYVSDSNIRIAYSFQEPRLFPHLHILKNLQIVHPDRDPIAILSALDLQNAAELYPQELSGGMQNRASIARALCKSADIYLFDEPTGGQDVNHAKEILQVIREYTENAICIIASHDIPLLSELTNNFMVIDHGKWNMYHDRTEIPESLRNQ